MYLKKQHIWLLSILSGLLMGMAWPVNGVVGLIFIAWIPLLFVRDFVKNNPRQFSRGAMVMLPYATFLVFNLYSTWWVSIIPSDVTIPSNAQQELNNILGAFTGSEYVANLLRPTCRFTILPSITILPFILAVPDASLELILKGCLKGFLLSTK